MFAEACGTQSLAELALPAPLARAGEAPAAAAAAAAMVDDGEDVVVGRGRPAGAPAAAEGALPRAVAPYGPLFQRFLIGSRNYSVQYSHIYAHRAAAMRGLVMEAAARKWGRTGPWRVCTKVIELQPDDVATESSSSGGGGGAASSSSSSSSSAPSSTTGTPSRVVGFSPRRAPRSGPPTSWLVCGTLYKDQPLKPSALDEYSGERALDPPKPRANYSSANGDTLVLEDDSGRVALVPGRYRGASTPAAAAAVFARFIDRVATGVVVAVLGRVLESGELAVDDVAVPGFAAAPGASSSSSSSSSASLWVPRPLADPTEGPLFMLLVSGLGLPDAPPPGLCPPGCVAPATVPPLAYELLLSFVTGMAAAPSGGSGGASTARGAARIARVVIAGGAIGKALGTGAPSKASAGAGADAGAASASSSGSGRASAAAPAASPASVFQDRAVAGLAAEAAAAHLRDADALLASMAASVAGVDVLPGMGDPTNFTLPQQPLHPCLLPAASRYSSFRRVPNPYEADVGGVRVLVSSGQPVADLARFVRCSDVVAPGDELGLAAQASQRRRHPGGLDIGEDEDEEVGGGGDGDDAMGSAAHAMEATVATGARHSGGAASEGSDGDAAEDAPGDLPGASVVRRLSPVDLLTNTLLWRHAAPTCPDTLPGYPSPDADPFVIAGGGASGGSAKLPHFYAAGGCAAFGSRWVADPAGAGAGAAGATQGVRVVAVPAFCYTGTAVLVDLRSPTLEAQPVCFGVQE